MPRSRLRARIVALSALLSCALAIPAGASAAVTLGPVEANPSPAEHGQAINWGESVLFVITKAPPGIRLQSPINGVIVRWRFYSNDINAPGATAQLRTLVPEAGKTYKAVASGPLEQLAEVHPKGAEERNLLHEYSARVPIGAGQVAGFVLSRPPGGYAAPIDPVFTGSEWELGCYGGACEGDLPPADGASTGLGSYSAGYFIAFNAEVEPDADGDLYGDESQDNCPGVGNPTQTDSDKDGAGDACDRDPAPPDTTLQSGPKHLTAKSRKAKAQFTFSSSDQNAGFECSVDGAPFAACGSPKTVRLAVGKHVFQVRAKSAAGTVDPTPASRAVKVSRVKSRGAPSKSG